MAVAGVAATVMAAAPPAHATTTTGIVLAAGGSDTTENVMDQILSDLVPAGGTSVVYNGNTYGVSQAVNIHATFSGTVNVPNDAECNGGAAGGQNWVKDPAAPASNSTPAVGNAPFGSGAGRDLLNFEETGSGAFTTQKGCIDIARSSSGTRGLANATAGKDTANFEYYAYGLDALSWASASLKAPATMTLPQLTGIYTCAAGFTDWGSLGGTPGPIKPYLPQKGSGTRSFFLKMLGLSESAALDACVPPATNLVEENNGSAIPAADRDKAIFPYSGAVWNFQESNRVNPTVDKRGGMTLRGFSPVTGAAGNVAQWNGSDNQYELATPALETILGNPASYGVVSESNTALGNASFSTTNSFQGVRYIFNVLDKAGSLNGYNAAKALLGFDNVASGYKSALCSGSEQGALLSAGFAPLDNSNPNSLNAALSTCRFTHP